MHIQMDLSFHECTPQWRSGMCAASPCPPPPLFFFVYSVTIFLCVWTFVSFTVPGQLHALLNASRIKFLHHVSYSHPAVWWCYDTFIELFWFRVFSSFDLHTQTIKELLGGRFNKLKVGGDGENIVWWFTALCHFEIGNLLHNLPPPASGGNGGASKG